MSPVSSRTRIDHMLAAIERIEVYVTSMNLSEFESDVKTQDAVIRCFMVLGEAVRLVEPEILQSYDYPWQIVRAFRNFMTHEYHAIKMERVYYAAGDLQTLKDVLESILRNEFS